MRRVSVLVAVLAVLPAAAAGSTRADASVLAIDRSTEGRELLLRVDPLTLRQRGSASLDLEGHGWPYAFSPKGSQLAFARWETPSLRLVRVRGLRVIRDVPLGGNRAVEIKAVVWLERQILVLLEKERRVLVLLRVAPATGEVVGSTTVGRWSADVATTRTRLVVLLTPIGRIGTARLLVATADRARTVGLAGIRAGSIPARPGKPYTVVQPGLAVSRSEPRAWVIGLGRSADVDLRTLAVRYRGEPRQTSSSRKQPVAGSACDAAWLVSRRVVVTCWEAAARDGDGKVESRSTGLRLLDATAWTYRTIHPGAMLFYVRPHQLLTIAPGQPDCDGPMLTSYTLAGVESYRVCDDRATGEFGLAGPYARLGRIDGRVTVVALADGAVVARLRDPRVTPLWPAFTQQR